MDRLFFPENHAKSWPKWLVAHVSAVAFPVIGAVIGTACGSSAPPPVAADTVVVLGVQSDPMGGLLGTVHVTATVAGVTQVDQSLTLDTAGALLPTEFRVTPPAGSTGASAPIDVKVEGYPAGARLREDGGGDPVLTRRVSASFEGGATKLLRVHLDSRCVVGPPLRGDGALACATPQTCISGRCEDVAPAQLEEYGPNWASDAPDICKPIGHGDPQVVVGTGQTDYLPIADGQKLQVELGPQGGHHVWIAVRMRNLKQSGSTTTITSVQPSTGTVVPPTAFVFTFDRDEGGYCKLFGLRYQLDNGAADLKNDYKKFLGQPLDISIEVADAAGSRTKSTVHTVIDTKVLCPTGIPNCT